jgi:hypothetical protein
MGSEIQPGIMRAQKREIQINRVTCLLIKSFIFSLKNFTFRSFYMELAIFFCNYSANLIENML